MNYDKVLEEIGELGRWQLVSLSLLALLAASNGVDNTFNVFTGDENIATKSWTSKSTKSKFWQIYYVHYQFLGYEPEAFMCHVEGCSQATDYSSLVKQADLFGNKRYAHCHLAQLETTKYLVHHSLFLGATENEY